MCRSIKTLFNFEPPATDEETAELVLAADLPRRLAGPMLARLEERGLTSLYREIELPLTRVLADMERSGVKIDVYRMGGQHVLGSGLYSSTLTAGVRHLPFTYPPVAALLFWPFSHLSTYDGRLVWDAIDLAAWRDRGVIA